MDFDAHVSKDSGNNLWKKDVLAVHNACADFSIPSYIEVSRSGNGGHLWIFFSENVLARLARNFGMALVKIAMQQRHSIPFESFDRFFPNQDEIQKGGYGNLIALPLQGKAVKEGHSVFVDENFIPYDDQWAHLSSVQKIDEKKIRRALAEIEKQIPDFVEKDESEKKNGDNCPSANTVEILRKEDFPQKVRITLSNYIEIEKQCISEKALGVLRRAAVFLNPEYFKNLKMRLPLYNIPRFIDCSKENEKCLLLPRGNLNQAIEILRSANIEYEITDNRESGSKIDINFSATLYNEQNDALNAMKKSDIGILSAGTGFGKTVVATALVAAQKTNALILVQSHALLEQWKKAVKKFLNFDAGTIAAGKDMSNGIIDIAIVNSLTEKKSDEVKARTYKYGMLIVDECHHVSAFTTENLVSSFRAKYVYGLTATPIRRDGHQKIIFYQCGPILYSTTAKQMNKTQNFAHNFIPRFSSFHYSEKDFPNESPNINEYYDRLTSNEARNLMIADDVKNAVADGRTPLVLSDRVEHLEQLKELLSACAKNVFIITGRGTQKQKRDTLEKLHAIPKTDALIILATGKYAGEGFDYPRIDTLMLAMPFSWKGTLSQYCGRLHRNFTGKEEVVIYDYVDFRIPVFDKMYQNRLKGYKQLGYAIKPESHEMSSNESAASSRIFSFEEHRPIFEKDVCGAKNKVIITTPFFSKREVQAFVPLAVKIIKKGVSVQIILRTQNDEEKIKKIAPLVAMFAKIGATVSNKENISQKIAVIDEKVLWYGNINFLGYTETEECSMRLVNPSVASEIEAEIV